MTNTKKNKNKYIVIGKRKKGVNANIQYNAMDDRKIT